MVRRKFMLRVVLGVIAGFFAWMAVWIGIEKVLSAVMPVWFGAPQAAFQDVIENGPGASGFTASTHLLVTHVLIASIVAMAAGFVSAAVSGENKRAPIALGVLLLVVGLLKVVMSWPYVPLWYHVLFTAVLLPMAILGGRLRTAS